jgi:hypothetical protein
MNRRNLRIAALVAGLALAGLASAQAGESTTTTTRTSTDDRYPNQFSFFYSTTKSTDPAGNLAYAIVDPSQPDVELIPDQASRDRIQRQIDHSSAPMLWFRQSGKSYVVTNGATVAAGRNLIEPVMWLQQAQSTVWNSQSEVGKEKSASDQRLSSLAQQLGELSLKEADARRKGTDLSDLAKQRRSLEEERAAIDEGQAQLAHESGSLEQTRQALSQQQVDLIKRISQEMSRLLAQARKGNQAELIGS